MRSGEEQKGLDGPFRCLEIRIYTDAFSVYLCAFFVRPVIKTGSSTISCCYCSSETASLARKVSAPWLKSPPQPRRIRRRQATRAMETGTRTSIPHQRRRMSWWTRSRCPHPRRGCNGARWARLPIIRDRPIHRQLAQAVRLLEMGRARDPPKRQAARCPPLACPPSTAASLVWCRCLGWVQSRVWEWRRWRSRSVCP